MSVAILALLLALPTSAPPAAPPDADAPTSDEVTRAVERELIRDPVVQADAIDVSTSDGVVTLSGTITDLLSRQRATRIAETVKGVRTAVNTTTVRGTARTDEQIERDVRRALRQDPATDAYEVGVSVEDAQVTLTGFVDSWAEKELAGTVAKGVRGVVWVDNRIAVEHAPMRSDTEIEKDVTRRLHWNVLVDDALIDVSVEDGLVQLTGTVGSAAEKRLARAEARVSGARAVDATELEVARWTRDDDLRGDKLAVPDDDVLRLRVERELAAAPRVGSFEVRVTVRDGRVVLGGHVDNLAARRVAERVTERVAGVRAVTNLLKVRPDVVRTDDDIEARIDEAITRSAYLDAGDVEADVHMGVATLTGRVGSYFEKSLVDDIVSRVAGVTTIRNELSVATGPYTYDPFVDPFSVLSYDWYAYEPRHAFEPDEQIAEDIRNELWWSPFVDAEDIDVTVEDGVATLRGHVESWLEWNAARDNAYEAGATFVRNRVTLQ